MIWHILIVFARRGAMQHTLSHTTGHHGGTADYLAGPTGNPPPSFLGGGRLGKASAWVVESLTRL